MAVSFQSIAAVSDVHQSHQSGAELLELEYEDQSDRNSQNDTSFKECQHCCSCHGVSCCYLENKKSRTDTCKRGQVEKNQGQTPVREAKLNY